MLNVYSCSDMVCSLLYVLCFSVISSVGSCDLWAVQIRGRRHNDVTYYHVRAIVYIIDVGVACSEQR